MCIIRDEVVEFFFNLSLFFCRTSSFQRTIPEAQIESDTESAPEEVIPVEDSNEDPSEDQNDDDYVPPQAPIKKKQKAANSGATSSDARKRRSAPKSNTADVSQMRGYSTLPRSRVSKASAVPEPVSCLNTIEFN